LSAGASGDCGLVVAGTTYSSSRAGEIVLSLAVGQEPIVADAVKALGQNMQQVATHELVGTELAR
jgi:hypothetical protein